MKEVVRHEDFLKLVGENIRRIRESKGFSQRELADISNTGKNQLGRIERGEVNARISTLLEVSRALGVSISEFFHSKPQP